MNRYPVWKYIIMLVALLIGTLYTLPNFYGEAPAVQVSSAKAAIKLQAEIQATAEKVLRDNNIQPETLSFDNTTHTLQVRFKNVDDQTRAKDALVQVLNPNPKDESYVVALQLLPNTPAWLAKLGAHPMYLGLDLRGGVHFMFEVDMQSALTQRAEALVGDIRTTLREKTIRTDGTTRINQSVQIKFSDPKVAQNARNVLSDQMTELMFTESTQGNLTVLTATFKPEAARKVQEDAIKQNISTLRNRINELGVAEPVIQQQGANRIVVQLPGVQDPARAKQILGRTATLEIRMVDESTEARSGVVPIGSERFPDRNNQPEVVKRQVILTGENLTDAQPGLDPEMPGQATVNLTLDSKGSRIFRDVTRESIGKRMAIILFEKGQGQVVTAPVIRSEIGGGRVQITGNMTVAEATDIALLLRSGSLAAPMNIIEELTIGPSMGEENISKGIHSVAWGFLAIVTFMCVYYMMFGLFSSIALGVNLLLLMALLSMLQATLTLPGIAAMALALGMAIDANVLINERVREELRNGASPQAAIHAGYDRAWATILDSNVTTLIAALALLAFGSGPVRGFAVVHSLGIITSMFSAVFFSRGLVNLWYGGKKKLQSVSIGTVWRDPQAQAHLKAQTEAVEDSAKA